MHLFLKFVFGNRQLTFLQAPAAPFKLNKLGVSNYGIVDKCSRFFKYAWKPTSVALLLKASIVRVQKSTKFL